MIRPGPFAPIILPRRKITPLSYSRSTRIALIKKRTTMIIRVPRKVILHLLVAV
jgi:hypothetical protein